MDKTSNKYRPLVICLVLAVTTVAVYLPVRNHEFIDYDDDIYVYKNQNVTGGLTQESVKWAFFDNHVGNWHPLTSLSHVLDWELYEADAGMHHLTGLLLHVLNALLVFEVFRRMTGAVWRSGFVAAAFALHPMHVESVAWVAERKDVLSTFFWLLTMCAYLGYARRPSLWRYLLTFFALALGLMSKPMVVTLPFVLLLLDFWPLGRFGNGRDLGDVNQAGAGAVNVRLHLNRTWRLVREKIPFFILSFASCIVTFLVERSGGTVAEITIYTPKIRIANAVISYMKYMGKMVWPVRLAVFYPHPGDKLSMIHAVIALLLLVCVTILVIYLARRYMYLPVGWFWYLGTLLPVIGLVQVGDQALADRYSYVPFTGLFVIIAWGAGDIFARWKYRSIVLGISMAAVVFAMTVCSRIQVRYWLNNITLFGHAVEVTDDHYITRNGLALALVDEGRLDEAIFHFNKVVEFAPDNPELHNNLGTVLARLGRLDEAIEHFTGALRIDPDLVNPHMNLGRVFFIQGKFTESIRYYRRYLEKEPLNAEVHDSLGIALFQQGELDEAESHFIEALRIRPEMIETRKGLASVLIRQGRVSEAVKEYQQILRILPDDQYVHNYLGIALARGDRIDEAMKHFTEALRIDSDFADAHENLAHGFVQQDKLEDAMVHYRQALRIDPGDAEAHNSLGVVFGKQGRLEEAIKSFAEALRIKPDFADARNNLEYARNQLKGR